MANNKVQLTQTIEKTLDLQEAYNELQKLKGELVQLEKNKQQLEKDIEEDTLLKNLTEIQKNLEKFKILEKDWENIVKPHFEELKKEISKEVKIQKAERGYGRISDSTQKIILQNEILAPILVKHNVDMGHIMVRELKRDFDTI